MYLFNYFQFSSALHFGRRDLEFITRFTALESFFLWGEFVFDHGTGLFFAFTFGYTALACKGLTL